MRGFTFFFGDLDVQIGTATQKLVLKALFLTMEYPTEVPASVGGWVRTRKRCANTHETCAPTHFAQTLAHGDSSNEREGRKEGRWKEGRKDYIQDQPQRLDTEDL